MGSNHVSYYVNVGQIVGIIGGIYIAKKAIDLEYEKLHIKPRSFRDVVKDFIDSLPKKDVSQNYTVL